MTKQTAIIIDFAAVKRAKAQHQPVHRAAIASGNRRLTAQRDRCAQVREKARAAL